ncbi:hypothetical protein [Brevibacterium pityocampae]
MSEDLDDGHRVRSVHDALASVDRSRAAAAPGVHQFDAGRLGSDVRDPEEQSSGAVAHRVILTQRFVGEYPAEVALSEVTPPARVAAAGCAHRGSARAQAFRVVDEVPERAMPRDTALRDDFEDSVRQAVDAAGQRGSDAMFSRGVIGDVAIREDVVHAPMVRAVERDGKCGDGDVDTGARSTDEESQP